MHLVPPRPLPPAPERWEQPAGGLGWEKSQIETPGWAALPEPSTSFPRARQPERP